jgi:predicted transcriptional regulator
MIQTVKQSVLDLAHRLPEDCTWDEVMYQVYVRQKIEAGLDDVARGRVISHEEVFRELANEPDQVDEDRAE